MMRVRLLMYMYLFQTEPDVTFKRVFSSSPYFKFHVNLILTFIIAISSDFLTESF